jgi:hypothetical protein
MPSLIGEHSGPWTQEEYQNLFDLVNLDLRVKAHQKFDHDHRLVCTFSSLCILCVYTSFHVYNCSSPSI